jgi:starch synthase (maltosyl-transferring)
MAPDLSSKGATMTEPTNEGRIRAVIESVTPQVDGGRFAAKRVVGDAVVVEADCFADGHDAVVALLAWRRDDETEWHAAAMSPLGNDRWRASFTVDALGRWWYLVTAWVDHFQSWRQELMRRVDAEDIRVAALVGAALLAEAAGRASGEDRQQLAAGAERLRRLGREDDPAAAKALGLDEELAATAARHPDRRLAATSPALPLTVERERARCSAWYELFPRSTASEPGQHGSFKDCIDRLPYVAVMGFDVLYLPPIHPVGRERRKGRNNSLTPEADDVGSPWAIGAAEGGHLAIHPQLGSPADFRALVAKAQELGLEIALDVALQCAPDHPWVREHPQWFRHRPDGSVQYAENPPKKYQDIYPFDFESEDWRAMWSALAGIFRHWIAEGVKIFRVDNPHTKAFAFWEWAIAEIRRDHPDVIFLSEAFTRPKVMHRLAKLGFSQSYTYFTWRNTKQELTDYFTELAHGPGVDYFRPNVWPNTPDILPEHLQVGGRPMFIARLVLAATAAANYGIYGPAFELMESAPREPGSEEYLDSEKYQLRHWALAREDSLAPLIGRLNRIRRAHPALQADASLRFLPVDNEQLIAYAKSSADLADIIVVVVNLDPAHVHSGWLELDLAAFGIEEGASYQMHDLLSDARFLWSGARNYIELDPQRLPAHVFRLRRRTRTERDFDYFL